MLHHQAARVVGSLITTNTPWWGIGAMITTAAYRMLDSQPPYYIHFQNKFYRSDFRGVVDHNPPNQFDWYFEKQPNLPTDFNVYSNEDPTAVYIPLNNRLEPKEIIPIKALTDKYWHPLPEHITAAEQMVPNPDKTLAVHYRGTDKWTEVPPTPLEQVYELIDKRTTEYGLEHVLICTDDEHIFTKIRAKYPKLITFDGHLRSVTYGVHQALGSYRQAIETFVEILGMGMCKHFICGRSNVANAVIITARNKELTWEYYN